MKKLLYKNEPVVDLENQTLRFQCREAAEAEMDWMVQDTEGCKYADFKIIDEDLK